jgi:hypothetical protein
MSNALNDLQQLHDRLFGRGQLHRRHEILPTGHHQKGAQDLIRALHEYGEVLPTRAVAARKPVRLRKQRACGSLEL